MIIKTMKVAKSIVIILLGFTILLIGILLLILPGPGILTIILGLFVLSIEFLWAREFLEKIKQRVKLKIH